VFRNSAFATVDDEGSALARTEFVVGWLAYLSVSCPSWLRPTATVADSMAEPADAVLTESRIQTIAGRRKMRWRAGQAAGACGSCRTPNRSVAVLDRGGVDDDPHQSLAVDQDNEFCDYHHVLIITILILTLQEHLDTMLMLSARIRDAIRIATYVLKF
jgi:hypothetical protein